MGRTQPALWSLAHPPLLGVSVCGLPAGPLVTASQL